MKPIFVLNIKGNPGLKVIDEIRKSMKGAIGKEYYTLAIAGCNETKCEVFYEKDFNHVKFEELKEIIKKM